MKPENKSKERVANKKSRGAQKSRLSKKSSNPVYKPKKLGKSSKGVKMKLRLPVPARTESRFARVKSAVWKTLFQKKEERITVKAESSSEAKESKWFPSKLVAFFSKKKNVKNTDSSSKLNDSMEFSAWSSSSDQSLGWKKNDKAINEIWSKKRLKKFKTAPARSGLDDFEDLPEEEVLYARVKSNNVKSQVRRYNTSLKNGLFESYNEIKRFPNQKEPKIEVVKKVKERSFLHLLGLKKKISDEEEEASIGSNNSDCETTLSDLGLVALHPTIRAYEHNMPWPSG